MPIHVERFVDDPIMTFIFEGSLDTDTTPRTPKCKQRSCSLNWARFYALANLRNAKTTEDEAAAIFHSLDSSALNDEDSLPLKFVFVKTLLPNLHQFKSCPSNRITFSPDWIRTRNQRKWVKIKRLHLFMR